MLIFTGRRGNRLWRYDKITKVQFRGNEFTFSWNCTVPKSYLKNKMVKRAIID